MCPSHRISVFALYARSIHLDMVGYARIVTDTIYLPWSPRNLVGPGLAAVRNVKPTPEVRKEGPATENIMIFTGGMPAEVTRS